MIRSFLQWIRAWREISADLRVGRCICPDCGPHTDGKMVTRTWNLLPMCRTCADDAICLRQTVRRLLGEPT
jgi:uncharacterized protein (DUF983 family)